MKTDILLSVIIVSYNTAELTVQAVKSVIETTTSDQLLAGKVEVLVVDNDSHDDSVARLRALNAPLVQVFATGKNAGFGAGNNYGVARSRGRYVLFLNSDTVVAPGALSELVSTYQQLEHNKRPIGMLAAQLLNRDGTYQPQGGDTVSLASVRNTLFFIDDIPFLGRLLPAVQHTGRRFDAREVDQKKLIEKGWVAGTAVLISRELIDRYGGWDEQIFMYGEDQEWCYRLSQAGFRHAIDTQARITHYGSASSGSKGAILGELRGYQYFFGKYHPEQLPILRRLLKRAVKLRAFIFAYLRRDAKRAEIYREALAEL